MVCPITQNLMKDPVIDPEGHSYERRAILKWLRRSHTSPITREYLVAEMLVPNRALKEILGSYAGLVARQKLREAESLERIEAQARTLRVRMLEIEGAILRTDLDWAGAGRQVGGDSTDLTWTEVEC